MALSAGMIQGCVMYHAHQVHTLILQSEYVWLIVQVRLFYMLTIDSIDAFLHAVFLSLVSNLTILVFNHVLTLALETKPKSTWQMDLIDSVYSLV